MDLIFILLTECQVVCNQKQGIFKCVVRWSGDANSCGGEVGFPYIAKTESVLNPAFKALFRQGARTRALCPGTKKELFRLLGAQGIIVFSLVNFAPAILFTAW